MTTAFTVFDTPSLKLDITIKTDQGEATITNPDSGKIITFTKQFADIRSIVVTPVLDGTGARIPVVDFDDSANPTQFQVWLFDDSGTKRTGDLTWVARGV